MGNFPENLAKILIFAGVTLILAGTAFYVLGKMGVFRLPGDMEWGGKNWKVYFPITSSIIISIVLTLIFWLVSHFRK
ncbi:MAG: DUF2905 domain-containing protein [Phycisphaerales bacterium]